MGTTVNTTQLAEILESHEFSGVFKYDNGNEEVWKDNGWHAWKEIEGEWEMVDGVGRVRVVEDFGGEGQGDNYYLVFEIQWYVQGGQIAGAYGSTSFFKLPGYYTSYEGGEYDGDLYEVKPVQKTITVWENV